MTWTRPKAETLALPIDALALLILHDYKAGDGWNWQNWMRGAEQQGTARDREIGRALSEGWSWLMTHGLVVRDPSQPSADAYVVSRLGEETLRYGVGKLAAAERLGMSLHPRIAQLVEQQFLLGEYDVAVFVAMREVEIRVRDLMRRVGLGPGHQADRQSVRSRGSPGFWSTSRPSQANSRRC